MSQNIYFEDFNLMIVRRGIPISQTLMFLMRTRQFPRLDMNAKQTPLQTLINLCVFHLTQPVCAINFISRKSDWIL